MSKKMITVAVIFAAVVLVLVVTVASKRRNVADYNATAEYLRAGNADIACKDAVWLMDTFMVMIGEKFDQIEKYEKPFIDNGSEIPEDIMAQMRQEIENNPSPAQAEITKWHNEVLGYIGELFKGNPTGASDMRDAIGRDYVEIYQGAMAVKLGMITEEDAKAAIEEKYCGVH